MHAQDLRQVRIRFAEARDEAKELAQRHPFAAVLRRYAQLRIAGFAQPFDGFVGKLAMPFAMHRAFCDAREHGREAARQRVVVEKLRGIGKAGRMRRVVV